MVRIAKFRFGKYIENFWSSQLLLTCSKNNINSSNNNKSKNKQTKALTTLNKH